MGAFRDRLRALVAALWPFRGDDSHLWVDPENAITRRVTASLKQQQFPALPAAPVYPQVAPEPVAKVAVAARPRAAAPTAAPSELDRAAAVAAAAAARVAKAPATTRREAPVPTRTARRRSRRAA